MELPDKLRDSHSHGTGTELFVVEGDSAALDRVRNRTSQAILPMQGKPMNTTKANIKDVVENVQFAALLATLGLTDAVREGKQEPLRHAVEDGGKPRTKQSVSNDATNNQVVQAMRYERVVLLFDPDADGIHSRTLVLLFFFRWLRPVLDEGKVMAAYPPLWKVTTEEMDEPLFAYTRRQLDQIRRRLADQQLADQQLADQQLANQHRAHEDVTDIKVKRYRGLSNHRGETILRLCVDPATRNLVTLTSKDAEDALKVFAQMKRNVRA